jgi:hypothetical protein
MTDKIAQKFKNLGGSPMPHWLPLVAGGFMLGSGSANLVYMTKSTYTGGKVSNPKTLEIFNIVVMCLGILLVIYALSPTIAYIIKKV